MLPSKILITGSSGYCGNFLAVHFAGQGIPVVGVDLAPHAVIRDIPNFKFVALDVRNGEVLKRVMEMEQPSHVIHLAYLMDPNHDRKYEYDVDVMGSKNALQAANATPSVKQFIVMSSTSAYGANPDNPDWITEDRPLNPGSYNYGVYKKEVEEYCDQFNKRSDLKLVVFRMCTAVGPSYYKKGGVVSSVANAPFLLDILGGNGKLQFIHEDDVKAIFESVAKNEKLEGTFNLVPNDFSSTQELGTGLKKSFIPMPLGLLRFIFGALWSFHLAKLTPAMARLMAYGIVASPVKLMDALGYRFKYSTKGAFMDAVEKRRQNGTL
ncbi:NAD-dependent epimerase/dehydratase family protein [Candidatus Peregrinibacteria bacterium]|nr:NAD-dependent epimerase/dehydratase family protein [Candidatus Peregrinibacteria bacterium]